MYCKQHTTGKREILLVRDVMNMEKVVMAVVHLALRKDKFADMDINQVLRGSYHEKGAMAKYIAERPDAWFVIGKRWECTPDTSTEKFQTLEVIMSLVTTLHNDVTTEDSLQKIHFINGDINIDKVNLEEINKGLELNGICFEIGDDNKFIQFKKSPHLPTNFDNKKPFVYVGEDTEGGYRFGEDHAEARHSVVKGSKGHLLQNTTMKGIDAKNIHNIFQADHNKFTAEESLQKSLEVETLGHLSVVVAGMMELKSVHGKDVKNLAKKFTHFDLGWDDTVFNNFIIMMTGKEIVVKKAKLNMSQTRVKFQVPIYKSEGKGEKARQVLDTDKMKKVVTQSKVYDKVEICWH